MPNTLFYVFTGATAQRGSPAVGSPAKEPASMLTAGI